MAGFEGGNADWKQLVFGGVDAEAVARERGLAWKRKAMFSKRRREAQQELVKVQDRLDGKESAAAHVQAADKQWRREQAKRDKFSKVTKIKLTKDTKNAHHVLVQCAYCGIRIESHHKSVEDEWGDTYCSKKCWNDADDGNYDGSEAHAARLHAMSRRS